jgi:ubiquinone/menaquinone biosynthesis C-methylase UbiE
LLLLTKTTVETVVKYVLLAGLVAYVLNQVRKPTRWVGRFFTSVMNFSHSSLTDWGLKHVQIEPHFTILDVGCGGGRTIEKLAALAGTGKVYGVDYANGSVAASRAKNAPLIHAGRVEITKASVSQLPFPEGKFDLVTAVETQYYWPDLVKDMQEILRVLKPGGTLIVIAESYKKGAHNNLQRPVMKFLRSSNLSVDDQRELFGTAGYTNIEISEETRKGWICAVGKKPLR